MAPETPSRKGLLTPKSGAGARKASPTSARKVTPRSGSPAKAKAKKGKAKKKVINDGGTPPNDIETELMDNIESPDVTPSASWRQDSPISEEKPNLYALRRCKNCTFHHFTLCAECPRCHDPQPIGLASTLEVVHRNTVSAFEEVRVGLVNFATDAAKGLAANAARAAESLISTVTVGEGAMGPSMHIFDGLDTKKEGKTSIGALVEATYAWFGTQATVYPEHWIRTQITKFDQDKDEMVNREEFQRAFITVVNS